MISLRQAVVGQEYIFQSIEKFDQEAVHLARLGLVQGESIRIISNDFQQGFIISIQESRIAVNRQLAPYFYLSEKESTPVETFSLAEGKIGQVYKVQKVLGTGAVRRHLMDMGVTKGTLIQIRKKAPFGDPIEINLRNYELTLRKQEAKLVIVSQWEGNNS